jgi:hypothetical protein
MLLVGNQQRKRNLSIAISWRSANLLLQRVILSQIINHKDASCPVPFPDSPLHFSSFAW